MSCLHVCEIMGFTIKDKQKHLIKCLLVSSSNEYLILTSMEWLITHKHTRKILYKSKHFPPRYKRKHEWLFLLSEKNTHSRFLLYLDGKCLDLYEIFRACLWGIRLSIEVKIKYSLHSIFYLLPWFRKTYSKTCKYDVRITSLVAMNI